MPRLLAANVLEDILYRKQTLEHSFPLQLHRRLLDTRDKSFAFHLILTTLRRLGQIDELIGCCLDRPLTQKAAGTRTILRLGVAQLLRGQHGWKASTFQQLLKTPNQKFYFGLGVQEL